MTDFTEDLIINMGLFGVFLLILAVGGVIADYVFPHIPPLQRWLDSLPDYEDDEEEMEWVEAQRRRRTARRQKHGRF